MKKLLLLMLTCALAVHYVTAQSKVFKEVSEEISSQVSVIMQDNALVGYLAFTRLEKVSEDSFNYKVTIMDENLNDIGTVNFREESIYLQGVAFEQDVLCMAYFKSNLYEKAFKNRKVYEAEKSKYSNYVMFQFLGLDGKIIATSSIPVKVEMKDYSATKEVKVYGKLKNDIQLINIPQYGFACFYGDDDKKLLSVYKPTGERSWQKTIKEELAGPSMLASGTDLYLLMKGNEGTVEVQSFGAPDGVVYPKYLVKDKKGHKLDILSFGNDPQSGKPYLCGYLMSTRRKPNRVYAVDIAKGYFAGIYTCNFTGHDKKDVKEIFSYWDDNSNSSISSKGYYKDAKVYADLRWAFKDYNGSTCFVGNSFVKRTKWGILTATVITLPLILPPIGILGLGGTRKARLDDPILVRQDMKGNLSYELTVPTQNNRFRRGIVPFSYLGYRGFSTVVNHNAKAHYLVVNDGTNTSIYNVNEKKVMRKVPIKDGRITTLIFPAKEGHIMVSEQNRKEKYTRVSIESL